MFTLYIWEVFRMRTVFIFNFPSILESACWDNIMATKNDTKVFGRASSPLPSYRYNKLKKKIEDILMSPFLLFFYSLPAAKNAEKVCWLQFECPGHETVLFWILGRGHSQLILYNHKASEKHLKLELQFL